MEESLELILEATNALIALVVIFLGLRLIKSMRFTIQKRSVSLFLASAILFALQETLAVVASTVLRSEIISVIREFIETAFIACLALAMYFVVKSEKQEISALHRSAETDDLTKLYNIAFFRRAASLQFQRAKEYPFHLTLLMVDIDDFKGYNDLFGHEAGNVALHSVAQVLRETARTEDLVARYGGEEFVSLVVTRESEALIAAERIRSNIELKCAPGYNPSLYRAITVSIGVATLTQSIYRLEELINKADKALSCAKKSGKNCVSSSGC